MVESYKKIGSCNKMACLVIMTCIIMSNSFVNNNSNMVQAKMTWTMKAAEEAEAVANINCSEHGRAFLDGIISEGSPKCECNTCYTGPDCSEKIQGCSADVASGDGLFLEEYWKQHKEASAVLVSPWHRMSYFFNPVSNFISFELEKTIKELHEVVGNAAAKDRYIVFGVGVTQLIHGLVISLSPNMTATPDAPESKVVAHAPFYPVFREQTKYFDKKGYVWAGNAANYVNVSNPGGALDMPLDEIIKQNKNSNYRSSSNRGGRGGPTRRPIKRQGNRPNPYTSTKAAIGDYGVYTDQLASYTAPAAMVSAIQTGTKLYISNLDYGVSNDDIKELFSEVGDLKKYSIHYDRSGRSKGTAEVVFARKEDALAAVQRYNNVQLDGKPMKIEVVGTNIDNPETFPVPNGGQRIPFTGSRSGARGRVGGYIGRPRGGFGGRRGAGRGSRGRGRGDKLSAADLDAELEKYHQSAAMETT